MYWQKRRFAVSVMRTKHTKNKHVSLFSSWRASKCKSVSSSLSSSTLCSLNSLHNCALTTSFCFWMGALRYICLSLALILHCRAFSSLAHSDITVNKAHTHTNTARNLNFARNRWIKKDDKFKPRRTQIHPFFFFCSKFVLLFTCHKSRFVHLEHVFP